METSLPVSHSTQTHTQVQIFSSIFISESLTDSQHLVFTPSGRHFVYTFN